MDSDNDLDPRIQIELESLNTATDEINKLEIELEESKSTFQILMNESTRRLTLLSKKLGACIDRARPYYEAQKRAKIARAECQEAAMQYQRANEIYAAAKETVALAEQRFMSNSHEWQFDNAWQEMLNHATIKVMDAEKQRTECHAEHQKKANIFSNAELKLQQLEDRSRRSIQKSRPYFEENQICLDQLETQKARIEELEQHVRNAKATYSTSLKNLETISEDIHRKRGDLSNVAPSGPRQPGVGAELANIPEAIAVSGNRTRQSGIHHHHHQQQQQHQHQYPTVNVLPMVPLPDLAAGMELMKCATDAAVSEKGCDEDDVDDDDTDADVIDVNDDDDNGTNDTRGNGNDITEDYELEALRRKVKVLAVRPVEGGDGQQTQDIWEIELNATVNKLDRLMMMRESAMNAGINGGSGGVGGSINGSSSSNPISLPNTPIKNNLPTAMAAAAVAPIKMLKKSEPLASVNASMRELPLLARISNEISERAQMFQIKRRLSLE